MMKNKAHLLSARCNNSGCLASCSGNFLKKVFSFFILVAFTSVSAFAFDLKYDGFGSSMSVERVHNCADFFKVTVSGNKFQLKDQYGALEKDVKLIGYASAGLSWENNWVLENKTGSELVFFVDARTIPAIIYDSDPGTVIASIKANMAVDNMTWGQPFALEYSLCPATPAYPVVWQWYDEDNATWTDLVDANGNTATDIELKQFATLHGLKYRLLVDQNGTPVASNEIVIGIERPSVAVLVDGLDSINRIDRIEGDTLRSYLEYEVKRKAPFALNLAALGVHNPVFAKVESRLLNEKSWTDVTADLNSILSSKGLDEGVEYKFTIKGTEYRTGDEAHYISNVIVRVASFCDEATVPDTLWFDDFGRFLAADEYEYKTGTGVDGSSIVNQGSITVTLEDGTTKTYDLKDSWAPDPKNAVRGHAFAVDDPKTQPVANCGDVHYEHYPCWENCNGQRVEDGFYAILSNPDISNCGMANRDYWSGRDHTGNVGGGMLFVNCANASKDKVVYEANIDMAQSCENAMLLFSAYINNATQKVNNAPVNVRLDIYGYDADNNLIATPIYSISSGDVYPRNDASNNWARLSFIFPYSGTKYVMKLVNNNDGGSDNFGNDILIDDICISVCYPDVDLLANSNEGEALPNVETCDVNQSVNLYAYNRNGIKNYIQNPIYRFQYMCEGETAWTDIDGLETDSIRNFSFRATPTSPVPAKFIGTTSFRVIVASDKAIIDDIVDNDAKPAVNCNTVYAVDTFKLVLNYGGPMGEDISTAACAGETLTLTGDAGTRTNVKWVNIKDTTVALSISNDYVYTIPAEMEEGAIDTFIFYGYDKGGCVDSQMVYVEKKRFVRFEFADMVADGLFKSCEDKNNVKLNVSTPAVLDPAVTSFMWTVTGKDGSLVQKDNTNEPSYDMPVGNDLNSLTGKVSVLMSVDGYCDTEKSFDYDLFKKYSFDVTSDVNDNKLCLGENGAEVNLTATASPETARPETYYWYKEISNANGTKDTVKLGETTVNTYKDVLTDNVTVNYFVSATDGVCYTTEEEAKTTVASSRDSVEARKPLKLSLAIDNSKVCEGGSIELTQSVENALNNNTKVVWSFTGINQRDTVVIGNSFVKTEEPVSTTRFMEEGKVAIATVDSVCTSNQPLAEVSYNLYKKMNLELTYNRTDSLFCLTEGKSNLICFTAVVHSGNPTNYYWFRNGEKKEESVINEMCLPIEDGTNKYTLKVIDGVCVADSADASALNGNIDIEARYPIKLTLSPREDSVCFGSSLDYNLTVDNALSSKTLVEWESDGADIILPVTDANSVANVITPNVPGERTTDGTLLVKTNDVVCGTEVTDVVSYKVFRKIDVKFDVSLTDGKYYCLNEDAAKNTLLVTAKDLTGEPSIYRWYMDGVMVSETKEKYFTYSVDEGKHKFAVVILDNVCHKEGEVPFELDYEFEAQKAIKLELAPADTVVCEGNDIRFVAKAENLWSDETVVNWSFNENFENVDNDTYVTTIPAGVDSTEKIYTPIPLDDAYVGSAVAEKRGVKITVDDKICRKTASASVFYKVNKKFVLDLVADGVKDNKYCSKSDDDKTILVKAVVKRGEPKKYEWSNGNVTEKDSTNYLLSVGDNKMGVTVSDGICPDVSTEAADSLVVKMRQPIKVQISADKASPMCVSQEVTYFADVFNSDKDIKTTVWWSKPQLGTETDFSNGIVYAKPYLYPDGDISDTVTVYFKESDDLEVCPQSSVDMPMDVYEIVKFRLDASSYGVCQDLTSEKPATITITATIEHGQPNSVVWFNGETTPVVNGSSSLTFVPVSDSQFPAFVVDDVCGNSKAETLINTVEVSHKINLALESDSALVQMGDIVGLNAINSKADYNLGYEWFINDTLSASTASTDVNRTDIKMDEHGEYVFYVRVDNEHCGYVYASTNVDVADYTMIPNAFSPGNGNVKNDIFMKGYNVQIFNRYQQVVFEGEEGWDGTYRDEPADAGTYFYIITKKDGRVLKGTVELVKF